MDLYFSGWPDGSNINLRAVENLRFLAGSLLASRINKPLANCIDEGWASQGDLLHTLSMIGPVVVEADAPGHRSLHFGPFGLVAILDHSLFASRVNEPLLAQLNLKTKCWRFGGHRAEYPRLTFSPAGRSA